MQVEIVKNVPVNETKPYLRVATISNKTALCYFYIGRDEASAQFLEQNFKAGFATEDLPTAKKLLQTDIASKVDVIFLDIPFQANEMRDFQSFIKNRDLQSVPVIYSGKQEQEAKNCELFDDIIDFHNWQFDLSSKISFLKKTKEYSFNRKQVKYDIRPSRSVAKRIVDIVVASLLLILLLPLFLIIALAIKLESRGPVFYNAKRAGRGFKIFSFYKFRTMVVNADKKIQDLAHLNQYKDCSNGVQFFKINNDPRITRVGRFLRNTSLDELPQLFNVLKGDMSLVGNRPLPLYEAATLTTNEFVERFMAPAGITGLWQIKKRGKSDMSAEERIHLDITYARNATLLHDFWIMMNTPKALLQKSDV